MAAKKKLVVWIGAAQASMLYGQQATERFLINLLGYSFGGPVAVLCPFCCNILEGVGRNYTKLGYNIVTVNANRRSIPSIHLYQETSAYVAGKPAHGIKELLQILEEGNQRYYSVQVFLP